MLPTLAALDSFPGRRIALIVGGHDRGIDYAPLASGIVARPSSTYVLTLPDSGPRIRAEIDQAALDQAARNQAPDQAPLFAGVTDRPDLESAVAAAYRWARPDGVVLLSPAAPSFGQFRDYRDRGEAFARAMRADPVAIRPRETVRRSHCVTPTTLVSNSIFPPTKVIGLQPRTLFAIMFDKSLKVKSNSFSRTDGGA